MYVCHSPWHTKFKVSGKYPSEVIEILLNDLLVIFHGILQHKQTTFSKVYHLPTLALDILQLYNFIIHVQQSTTILSQKPKKHFISFYKKIKFTDNHFDANI